MLDSLITTNKRYKIIPQTLLDEHKYEVKNTKMENLINDDLDPSISDIES